MKKLYTYNSGARKETKGFLEAHYDPGAEPCSCAVHVHVHVHVQGRFGAIKFRFSARIGHILPILANHIDQQHDGQCM